MSVQGNFASATCQAAYFYQSNNWWYRSLGILTGSSEMWDPQIRQQTKLQPDFFCCNYYHPQYSWSTQPGVTWACIIQTRWAHSTFRNEHLQVSKLCKAPEHPYRQSLDLIGSQIAAQAQALSLWRSQILWFLRSEEISLWRSQMCHVHYNNL